MSRRTLSTDGRSITDVFGRCVGGIFEEGSTWGRNAELAGALVDAYNGEEALRQTIARLEEEYQRLDTRCDAIMRAANSVLDNGGKENLDELRRVLEH